jgi:hypothetical protein
MQQSRHVRLKNMAFARHGHIFPVRIIHLVPVPAKFFVKAPLRNIATAQRCFKPKAVAYLT